MPAKVILRVVKGPLAGQCYEFEERSTCLIGRDADCIPQLPSDQAHATISRHHCLLDINPPDARVRDFGSMNGTFVNGSKIGQRAKDQSPEAAAKITFPEHDLRNGDEIGLGGTAFRVEILVPPRCVECGTEISAADKDRARVGGEVYQCAPCKKKAEEQKRKEPPKPQPRRCAKCGRDVAGEGGAGRAGDYLCLACRKDPAVILRMLLELAQKGEEELVAIQSYTIEKELGRGGFGAVYLAQSQKSGRRVALKVMLPEVAADEANKGKFMRETAIVRALDHPNIVRLFDFGCSRGTFFFTMEYCEGGSVLDLMQRAGGSLPFEVATKIILQLLDGLEYAHTADIPSVKLRDGSVVSARGVVHRDIKPGNFFLTAAGSGAAKVGDYGLGKAFEMAGLSGHTRTGMAAGTPAFMPRQQVINFKYARPDVDVWAAAASYYCMLTGCVPRDFPRGVDPWRLVLQTRAVPILQRNPRIPARAAEVIDAALLDQPAIGCSSAGLFKAALLAAL